MKTIVCAIDYSPNAIAALKYADKLCSKIKSKLYVLHIYDTSKLKASIKKEQITKLKNFCIKHLGQTPCSKNIEIEVIEDTSIIHGINTKVSKVKASLILTGLKGKSKFKSFLIGSTTKELISNAPCPILAVPKNQTLKQFNTIVYATAFEKEDICALIELSKIAAVYNAEIKVIHIAHTTEKESKLQMQWLKKNLLKKISYRKINFNLYNSNDTLYFLKLYLKEIKADMVAMLERNKNKNLLTKIFHNDLVIEMEISSEVPLISFNDNYFN